ncbi:MAG: hypothetical protein KTR28_05955 [Micavibrio sp.]|nr:hypothetical protein [Micavibrio sp.]
MIKNLIIIIVILSALVGVYTFHFYKTRHNARQNVVEQYNTNTAFSDNCTDWASINMPFGEYVLAHTSIMIKSFFNDKSPLKYVRTETPNYTNITAYDDHTSSDILKISDLQNLSQNNGEVLRQTAWTKREVGMLIDVTTEGTSFIPIKNDDFNRYPMKRADEIAPLLSLNTEEIVSVLGVGQDVSVRARIKQGDMISAIDCLINFECRTYGASADVIGQEQTRSRASSFMLQALDKGCEHILANQEKNLAAISRYTNVEGQCSKMADVSMVRENYIKTSEFCTSALPDMRRQISAFLTDKGARSNDR